MADNTANPAESAALENQADALERRRRAKEEAIDDGRRQRAQGRQRHVSLFRSLRGGNRRAGAVSAAGPFFVAYILLGPGTMTKTPFPLRRWSYGATSADRARNPTILVVERAAGMAFAAGAIVFPGGRIDDADRDLADALGRPDDAAKITAIRETIEETASLPAVSGSVDRASAPQLQRCLASQAPTLPSCSRAKACPSISMP